MLYFTGIMRFFVLALFVASAFAASLNSDDAATAAPATEEATSPAIETAETPELPSTTVASATDLASTDSSLTAETTPTVEAGAGGAVSFFIALAFSMMELSSLC